MRSLASILVFAVVAAGLGCGKATEGMTFFSAQLSGSNEVPPVSTAASGACGFQLDGNQVHFSIEGHGVSNVIGAHIHIGPPGVNGPVRVVLWPFPGGPVLNTTSPLPSVNGVLASGTFTGSHVTGGLSFNDVVGAMRSGNAYCNVHTSRFPGGEMRGPIVVASN